MTRLRDIVGVLSLGYGLRDTLTALRIVLSARYGSRHD